MDFYDIISTVVLPAVLLMLHGFRLGPFHDSRLGYDDSTSRYLSEMEDEYCRMQDEVEEVRRRLGFLRTTEC